MTAREAVQLIDESAMLRCYSSSYWVVGSNWETPFADTPEHAWELAVYKGSKPASSGGEMILLFSIAIIATIVILAMWISDALGGL